MALTHAQLWKGLDALAARQGLTPSALARAAGLDPTSFNRSKRFGPGEPPRPRWPSTESLTLALDVAGVSLGDFARLARDAASAESVPLLGMAQAGADGFFAPGLRDGEAISALADGIGMPLNLMAVPGLADAEGLKALGVRRLSAGSSLSEAAFGLLRTRAGAFLQTGEATGLGEGAMPYPEINGIMRTA